MCNKSWNPGRPPSSWLFSHRADYAHLPPLLYFPPYYIFKFIQHSLHCVRENDFLDSLKYFGTLCLGRLLVPWTETVGSGGQVSPPPLRGKVSAVSLSPLCLPSYPPAPSGSPHISGRREPLPRRVGLRVNPTQPLDPGMKMGPRSLQALTTETSRSPAPASILNPMPLGDGSERTRCMGLPRSPG